MIKIIADQNLYHLNDFLPDGCELITYNPQEPIPLAVNPDAWLLNTVTKVNPNSYPALPASLKFIGTGSSGSDHLNIPFLQSKSVRVEDAKGCNARAVAEYVVTSLLLLKEEKDIAFQNLKIGIVGVGSVGTIVNELLIRFGCETVLFDPPRARSEEKFHSSTEAEVLDCDILTIHTPLIFDGDFPTYHWLDEAKLSNRNFEVIINAARGGVVEEADLLQACKNGNIGHMITDVWENEPDFNPELADYSIIATPHIAGYSEQAKLNASRIIAEKCCHFFGLEVPSNGNGYTSKSALLQAENHSLCELLTTLNPILEYDKSLRNIQNHSHKTTLFPKLRTALDYRYEYRFLDVEEELLSRFPALQLLRS